MNVSSHVWERAHQLCTPTVHIGEDRRALPVPLSVLSLSDSGTRVYLLRSFESLHPDSFSLPRVAVAFTVLTHTVALGSDPMNSKCKLTGILLSDLVDTALLFLSRAKSTVPAFLVNDLVFISSSFPTMQYKSHTDEYSYMFCLLQMWEEKEQAGIISRTLT